MWEVKAKVTSVGKWPKLRSRHLKCGKNGRQLLKKGSKTEPRGNNFSYRMEISILNICKGELPKGKASAEERGKIEQCR